MARPCCIPYPKTLSHSEESLPLHHQLLHQATLQHPCEENPMRLRKHFRPIQVEEVVAGTNTGMSLALAGYYHYWEKCIFNAITKCIISSMATFLALLQSKDRPPLCEVKANLNGKDLVVTPTVNDSTSILPNR